MAPSLPLWLPHGRRWYTLLAVTLFLMLYNFRARASLDGCSRRFVCAKLDVWMSAAVVPQLLRPTSNHHYSPTSAKMLQSLGALGQGMGLRRDEIEAARD
ncbi:hypothetical protein PsYK624_154120 [Phanerochaete sordida]|uniref:Uncharacterized protein n=1 Tax=Phanerochaete sordida TaxID=48140 RepID=A0A9P3GT49_9APHY|nr:hypothetical protein PsYK624_154120 [Phanerochaete sordida]